MISRYAVCIELYFEFLFYFIELADDDAFFVVSVEIWDFAECGACYKVESIVDK